MELTSGNVSSTWALPLVSLARSPIIGTQEKGQVEVEPMQERVHSEIPRVVSDGLSLPWRRPLPPKLGEAGTHVKQAREERADQADEEHRRRDPCGGDEREE